jgi:ribose transport system permease protein
MAKPIIRNAFKPVMTGRAVGLLIATILLSCFTASVSHTFLSSYTVFVLSRQMAFSILVALAQAVCLVVGGMNMSVGAIGSMATVIMGICFQDLGLNAWLTVPLVLLFGLAAGLLNGLIITKLRINSFIVTLSTMFVYMGLRSGISGGSPYTSPDDFGFIGQESLFNVSWVFVLVILILAGAAYVFSSTVFGRQLLATGGNESAARLCGIATDQMILWAHGISGILAGLAAVLWASMIGSAAPETGDTWLIGSFAVAIIGGTGLNGGSISIPGIFLGGAIFILIQNGLIDIKANPYFANSFLGGLILLAIVLDRVREIVSSKRNPGEELNRAPVLENTNRPPGTLAAPVGGTHQAKEIPKGS